MAAIENGIYSVKTNPPDAPIEDLAAVSSILPTDCFRLRESALL